MSLNEVHMNNALYLGHLHMLWALQLLFPDDTRSENPLRNCNLGNKTHRQLPTYVIGRSISS